MSEEKKMISNSILHHVIIDQIIRNGFAGSVNELSNILIASREEIDFGLNEIAKIQGVVLHPDSSKIWVIHPFSFALIIFIVKSDQREWW